MANIKVVLDYTLCDGINLTFKAPCDCSDIIGLIVYYPDTNGIQTSKTFAFKDAHKNNLGTINDLFVADTYVNVILNTIDNEAYIQNADTNTYIENRIDSMAMLTRGPYIITESQEFNLGTLGIKIGDVINVVCIGGGGGGGSAGNYDGGNAGEDGTDYGSNNNGGRSGFGYGAGGGGAGSISTISCGGGGGGSGYIEKASITVDTLNIPVIIGAGGAGGIRSNGNAGGSTSFGSYLSAEGGDGGYKGGGSSSSAGGAGGNNGKAGQSSPNYYGGAGGNGFVNTGTFAVSTAESGNVVSGNGCVMIWW